mmetsp:Transcript_16079/g.34492  ORF Transcript_16079/g.34492 Transcript_16079/m.34492 type:complete len:411 (+) Transcript_16079:274-1506(+)
MRAAVRIQLDLPDDAIGHCRADEGGDVLVSELIDDVARCLVEQRRGGLVRLDAAQRVLGGDLGGRRLFLLPRHARHVDHRQQQVELLSVVARLLQMLAERLEALGAVQHRAHRALRVLQPEQLLHSLVLSAKRRVRRQMQLVGRRRRWRLVVHHFRDEAAQRAQLVLLVSAQLVRVRQHADHVLVRPLVVVHRVERQLVLERSAVLLVIPQLDLQRLGFADVFDHRAHCFLLGVLTLEESAVLAHRPLDLVTRELLKGGVGGGDGGAGLTHVDCDDCEGDGVDRLSEHADPGTLVECRERRVVKRLHTRLEDHGARLCALKEAPEEGALELGQQALRLLFEQLQGLCRVDSIVRRAGRESAVRLVELQRLLPALGRVFDREASLNLLPVGQVDLRALVLLVEEACEERVP